MPNCRACAAEAAVLLDFGAQPICNRFLARAEEAEYAHPVALGQCGGCGLVQLTSMPPASELRPRQDWITYSEPEPHLDRLADVLAALPGVGPDSVACGVSFKDDTTLRRLAERGVKRSWRLEPSELGSTAAGVGVETVQDLLTPARAAAVAAERGAADLVVVRHILEHAFDLPRFFAAVRALAKPSAYFVFEAPDCRGAMLACDYSTVWEEHAAYFTQATYLATLRRAGFEVVHFENVPYALENSLVVVARAGAQRPELDLEAELALGRSFAAGLRRQAERLRAFLDAQPGGVALFGAGHLACAFINLLGLKDKIRFVADDHPRKKGLFMPGSRLPIRGSQALVDDGVKLCLLSLHPDSEEKVIANNKAFVDGGGMFRSIFPASRRALAL